MMVPIMKESRPMRNTVLQHGISAKTENVDTISFDSIDTE
jgi:hypothetical protein